MKNRDIFEELQFSEDWVNLGIVTPELLEELKTEYEKGADTNTEHYRWRAFSRFMSSNKTLSPEVIKGLYMLGSKDPDELMGGAMMRELLDRKDCPRELLEVASQSDRGFLVKAAQRAIERRIDK